MSTQISSGTLSYTLGQIFIKTLMVVTIYRLNFFCCFEEIISTKVKFH